MQQLSPEQAALLECARTNAKGSLTLTRVLELKARGLAHADIARQLNVSVQYVHNLSSKAKRAYAKQQGGVNA